MPRLCTVITCAVPRDRYLRRATRLCSLVLLGLMFSSLLPVPPASALVRFDFEQRFYQHPGQQVWDFSIIRADSIYHIFYHAIPEANLGATNADTIWHASGPDLKHWDAPEPVLTVGPELAEAGAVWAPDVFRDEDNQRWVMFYTGCDAAMNQTIGMAFSYNLRAWTKVAGNPTVEPDTSAYIWDAAATWSDFRDPYIYRQDNLWHVLVTAKQDLNGPKGVIYHGTSTNLVDWTDVGPLFVNDGSSPGKVLESCQYKTIGTTHHLLFGEFDTMGVTILSAADPADWTMATRTLLDYGYAPEVDEFDTGQYVFARLAPFAQSDAVTTEDLSYVVRIDTLLTDPDGSNPRVYRPHPMDDNWVVHSGTINLASPTFGDNPLWRGEPSVGLVGNSYFSSKEYYQGPLSGRGAPGTQLGDAITGLCESYRFPVTGNRMTLLVGGGNYPTTCYVALVAADTDEILFSETGRDTASMTLREWDLTPYQGRMCYITIVDQETGHMGYINVDEICEVADYAISGTGPVPHKGLQAKAWPNPFNPQTSISFVLSEPAPCEVLIHDLRGHLVWRSGPLAGRTGTNSVIWNGRTLTGGTSPTGTYLYAIKTDGVVRAADKISLVK